MIQSNKLVQTLVICTYVILCSTFTQSAEFKLITDLPTKINYALATAKTKFGMVPLSDFPQKTSGKWQVGRVSRKHYEIINMLWRKTKIFVDSENRTNYRIKNFTTYTPTRVPDRRRQLHTLAPKNFIQKSFQLSQSKNNRHASTPSFIEFYYLDESDERIKNNDLIIKDANLKSDKNTNQFGEYKFALLRPPFYLFRVNDETCKPTTSLVKATKNNNNQKYESKLKKYNKIKTFGDDWLYKKSTVPRSASHNVTSLYSTFLSFNKVHSNVLRQEIKKTKSKNSVSFKRRQESFNDTTAYDRIRFFEMYDSDSYTTETSHWENNIKIFNNNFVKTEEKIRLDQVDVDIRSHDANTLPRFVKKHVSIDTIKDDNDDFLNYIVKSDIKFTTMHKVENTTKVQFNSSQPAIWSNFPFVAVYIYEPAQVRCDSASISPHWLVAAATCLSRYHKDPKAEGRSAFISYCSASWRYPDRIAYVKQSLVHPRFHPTDITRRHLYNIGVIQVVNSMSTTCNGWRPISLMSHQFMARYDGVSAIAVGWGLDRYDMNYATSELPKYPLMMYEGMVYSDSCPGNIGYSKVKRLNAQSVKNLYCLSLPPYSGEDSDAVHGGLLLIGGKLIALYSQEERRPWGAQSAEYTGIWRLVPWLLDVAREPEDLENFGLEI